MINDEGLSNSSSLLSSITSFSIGHVEGGDQSFRFRIPVLR